jgi:hypothetical protein
MKRPIGVTILAILAVIAAVLAGIVALRFLFGFGPGFSSLWYALLYALLAYIWIWLAKMLWDVEEAAWLFLAVITIFNLTIAFITVIGAGAWVDVQATVIFNGLILIYIMLPGTRRAFGRE